MTEGRVRGSAVNGSVGFLLALLPVLPLMICACGGEPSGSLPASAPEAPSEETASDRAPESPSRDVPGPSTEAAVPGGPTADAAGADEVSPEDAPPAASDPAPSAAGTAADVPTTATPAGSGAPFRFVDVAPTAGLTDPTWCGSRDKPHILESGGTGLAWIDYDGDGDLDLYLVNGWRIEDRKVAERGRNHLYRNRGDGTFEDVTDAARVGDDGWGTGVTVGDADGDGLPDLFVSNFGPDVLYRNRGDGAFEALSDPPGLDGWSTGAVFFDADRDGDEDLYVAAYIDCTLEEVLQAEPTLEWNEVMVMLGPFGLEGEANHYFENLGGGRFRDATEEAGLTDVGLYYSFAVGALDVDDDLDLDLYVANDSNPNYLYINDGSGRFQEAGLWSGAALDAQGNAQGGMGMAAGDVDGDLDPDLFVTNFERDFCTLYENLGDALFADVTRDSGIRDPSFRNLSWGASFSDLDLDGDLDLFVANGHIYPQATEHPLVGLGYEQPNLLFAGEDGRFVDVTDRAGPGLAVVESSRGLAVGDMDDDGDLDLAIANCDAPPTLLRNDTERKGSWLRVDAPGALRVTVEAGGRTRVRHRLVGGTYVSAHDPRFHFGLGPVERIERLTVLWPDGSTTERTDVPVDSEVTVRPEKTAPSSGA